MSRTSRGAARSVRATARDQGGYCTAKQARRSGYDYAHLEYLVSTGAFERIEPGLYRLADMPMAADDDSPLRRYGPSSLAGSAPVRYQSTEVIDAVGSQYPSGVDNGGDGVRK